MDNALALEDQLSKGEEVMAGITIKTTDYVTHNIIAETIERDHDSVIFVSAHSDSVPAEPELTIMVQAQSSEIAIQLTNFSSSKSDLEKIRLLLNFDMLASPNYSLQVYDGHGSAFGEQGSSGTAEAEKEFERFFTEELGQNYTEIEFDGLSDYQPFFEAGVANGATATGIIDLKTYEEANYSEAW
ncbi:uncharacterized protein RSE6_08490 [Rhynchosporium secalis]|uniref:Peptide hydrolase n=1 Tax=Rhynchosporium secalis TaxID=38038 RepID=A0A1E1MFJ6_RHYSE|nr:uncharacterized protein RSE6_08490 [Rhynchosporium secalis]